MTVTFRYVPEQPPAPYVMVMVASLDGSQTTTFVPGKLDTGADRTLIPVSLIETFSIEPVEIQRFSGLGGHIFDFPIYELELTIQGLRPIFVKAGASGHEQYPLLGRDVLNRFNVHLDGPNQKLHIV